MSMSEQQNETLASLRQELKVWEKSFAAANGGRKAGRDDIRKDSVIAAKYKEYDRLRRPSQDKITRSPSKSFNPSFASPSQGRRSALFLDIEASTPSRRRTEIREKPLPSPIYEPSPTPQALRRRLGPTPQKDGQILSLFEGLYSATPSKGRTRDALAPVDVNILGTPSHVRTVSIQGSPVTKNGKASRTPASSGGRYLMDAFATPNKRKLDDIACTPSDRKDSHTPTFLRRTTTSFGARLGTLTESDEHGVRGISEPPFKKRGVVRSLSSIIRNLKDQEEERLDEQLDLLREMEEADDEEQGDAGSRQRPKQRAIEHKTLPKDDEPSLPLGPDRAPESEEEGGIPADGLDQNGQPRKVWKKKGLKRQTKRVISTAQSHARNASMLTDVVRPVRPSVKKVDVSQEAEEDIVLETQLQTDAGTANSNDQAESDLEDESDFIESDSEAAKQRKKPAQKPVTTEKGDKTPLVKKVTRKVSALAHANFRKLKIKNKNSKANGRCRFGRR